MLGYSHATSGALVWLATAPALSQALTGAPMSAPELAAGTVICAGAALLPDLDHPQATIAHTFGPVSHVASKLTFILSGGHRQGTHSLLFSVGFGLFAMLTGVASHAWHSTTRSRQVEISRSGGGSEPQRLSGASLTWLVTASPLKVCHGCTRTVGVLLSR
jgi:membrane-bound metal-dependent hydrolase YbcI (DUF457 family)